MNSCVSFCADFSSHGEPYSREAEGSRPNEVHRESFSAREGEACDGILVYVASFRGLAEADIRRRILDCQSNSLEGLTQWRQRNTTIYDRLDGQTGTGTAATWVWLRHVLINYQIKAENASNDAIVDDTAGQAYVEQFGMETFQRADRAVQAGKVTK